jgi:ketosteroid isomerase-like protein
MIGDHLMKSLGASSLTLAVLMLWSSMGIAQNWSSSEKEIWNLEKDYLTHLKDTDFQALSAFWHQRFIGWPSHSSEPVLRDDGIASLEELSQSMKILSFHLNPLTIRVIGEVALVHYRVDLEILNAGGDRLENSYRITHTWLKDEGSWKILGGMSSTLKSR